ncbi:MAG: MFS transporter [Deltaproteobacteria bacterium]|jgi:nitrate/nitrite transporter NarK|nr:MFS transporter [Deltaproteobacteria bacterium]
MSKRKDTRYLNLFILAWGSGFIYLLPYLRYQFYDPLQRALEVDHTMFGISMSAYGLVAMLTYWPGGWLADRYSPRKLLTISYTVTGLVGLYFSTFPSYIMGVVCHALWGMSTTLTFWASLIRATKDMAGGEEQGRFFGLLEGVRGLISTLAAIAVAAVFARFADEQLGLRWSIIIMSLGVLSAAVLTWFSFKDPKEMVPSESLTKDILATIKMPMVWAVAFLVFSCYGCMVLIGGYAPSYMTEVLAVSASATGFLAAIWNYGCQFLAGPAGGVIADKIGSRPKVASVLYVLLALTGLGLWLLPANPGLKVGIVILIILSFASMYAIRGVYFALIEDLKVPIAISGGAIGLASMIGFTPDAFMYTLAGWILDTNPGALGYKILFCMGFGLALIGVIMSCLVLRHVKKLKEAVNV